MMELTVEYRVPEIIAKSMEMLDMTWSLED